MARISKRSYNTQVMLVMAVYVVLMVFEWPLVAKTSDIALRTVLALLPVLPVVVVIAIAARRVIRGDELEQRIQLIALSVAVGVVSVASLVGAFLAIAKIWNVGGDVLIWVFPALCLVYGVTHVIVARKTTGVWDFWGC
ncbi:MAG TPA: hypothetical protein VF284_05780 [Rhodanobacteraceae bacterium]